MADQRRRVLADAHRQLGNAHVIASDVATLLGEALGRRDRATIKALTARTELGNALAELSARLRTERGAGE